MNEHVIKYLEEQGYENIPTNYYKQIENWENYWKNNTDYLTYKDFYGKERKMYTLGMAKTICEDWGSILWSEEDDITCPKENINELVYNISTSYDLKNRIPESVETCCWSGTCAAIIRLNNVVIDENQVVKANNKTKKELVIVNGKNIIPLKIEHNKIVDVAFVSKTSLNSKDCIYLEIHKLLDEEYEIRNVYLDEQNGKEIKNEDVIEILHTGTTNPWFSILTPPKINPIKQNLGLGFSVYGNALDQIKACDIAYNNFVMDLYLGGKKIIYNKKLIKYKSVSYKNSNGETEIKEVPVYPDDISKQQFMEVGDGTGNANDKELIHEYNPALRVDDNEKAVQLSLNVLSRKTMLGSKYYSFENGTVVTATQFVGDRQDFVKNAKKFRNKLNQYIVNIIKTSLAIEQTIFGNKEIKGDEEILVGSTDGFMVDQETERQQAREDLAIGVISKVEYRMKVFHETKEEAEQALKAIDSQYEIDEDE